MWYSETCVLRPLQLETTCHECGPTFLYFCTSDKDQLPFKTTFYGPILKYRFHCNIKNCPYSVITKISNAGPDLATCYLNWKVITEMDKVHYW